MYLLDSIRTTDPNVLAATVAVRQDEVNKRVNFKSSFTFLAHTCPVTGKLAKKGRVSFEANVSGTNGKPQGGLDGDHKKPGKGASGVALCYHKFAEFKNLSKDQQDEFVEWNKANGCGKGESLLSSKTYPRINMMNLSNGIRQMDAVKEKKVVGREAKGVNKAPQEAVPVMTPPRS
jgi:hypothetical protein